MVCLHKGNFQSVWDNSKPELLSTYKMMTDKPAFFLVDQKVYRMMERQEIVKLENYQGIALL
jgi:hypothetical protein